MSSLLTGDAVKEEAVKSDPLHPTLDFPSMDPVRSKAQAEMRQKNIEAEWAKRVDRDQMDADRKAGWHRYQALVEKQGGVDVLSLPWNAENWFEKFTEWEASHE